MVEKTPQISLDFEDSDTVKDDDTKFSKSGIDETQLKGLKIDIKDIQADMRNLGLMSDRTNGQGQVSTFKGYHMRKAT